MIKQIKTGFKLLPYTYGKFTNIFMCVVLLFCGIAASMFGLLSAMGMYLLVASGMCMVQMLYSVSVSDMVQTSPWKKPIQTSVSAWMSFIGFSAAYLISFLLQLVRISNHPDERVMAGNVLLVGGVVAPLMMIYIGLALKYFVRATVLFFAAIWGLMYYVQSFSPNEAKAPFGVCVAVGFGLIVAGALAQYGITLLVYRKPVAKRSQLVGLRKAL